MYTEEDVRMIQVQMQQQLEQELAQRQQAVFSSKMPMSQEFHLHRINFDDDIQEFSNWLKGNIPVFTDEGIKKYEKRFNPIMNEKGCSRITSVVSAFLKKSIILGYLEDEQILIKMNYFMKTLSHLVCLNSYDWELDKTERTMLVAEIVSLVHLTMTRALGGNEADQLSTAISRIEHADIKNQQQPQGFSLGRALSLRQR